MSIIEQALRKLELSRWNEQQVASEYLKPTPIAPPGGRSFSGSWWLVAGALAVTAGVVVVNWPDLARSRPSVSALLGSSEPPALAAAPAPALAKPGALPDPGQGQGQGQSSRQVAAATAAPTPRSALAAAPATATSSSPDKLPAPLAALAGSLSEAGKPKDKAALPVPQPVPASTATPADEPDPARSVQGSAVSSADAIMRRFTSVERLVAKGQFEAALEAVVLVEADVGETWQTRYLKGAAAKGLARWDEAIAALTRAHQLNPFSVKVLLDRAICLQELGNHAGALDDLHLASALNPHMPEVVLNAGYSLDALGRRSEALREYKVYLDMTADRTEYAKVRAWVVKRLAR